MLLCACITVKGHKGRHQNSPLRAANASGRYWQAVFFMISVISHINPLVSSVIGVYMATLALP